MRVIVQAAVYDAGTQLCVLKDATSTAPGQTSSNPNQYYLENGCLLGQRGTGGTPAGRALLSRKYRCTEINLQKLCGHWLNVNFSGFFQRFKVAKSHVKSFTDEPTPDPSIFDEFFTTVTIHQESSTTKLIPVEDEDDKIVEPLPSELSSWTHWSICKFNIGGRKSRVRTRNCLSFSKCPDKDIEFEICTGI